MIQRPSLRRPADVPVNEYIIRSVLVAAAYYVAGRLGLMLAFAHSNVTPFWPPSGIAVAALLLLGVRYWPALLASAFVLNLTTGLHAPIAACLAVGNSLEYVLAAALLRRAGFALAMNRVIDVLVLTVFGAAASPLVAATIGTASLVFSAVVARTEAQHVFLLYLVGDGVGILVFTPALLAWSVRPRAAPTLRELFEAALLTTVTAGFADLVFLGGLHFAYLVFPLAIVAAVRFGLRGATASTLGVSIIAVYGITHGLGPFVDGSILARVVNLQVFLAAYTLTALTLAATVMAQRAAERAVLEHAGHVEESNRELEAFAYTIAHDLRAPLRAINGFSQAVIEDYAETLPTDANRSLDRIASNAVAMGRLIDALLDFSRLGSKRVERTTLRPGAIAQQAFDRLRVSLPDERKLDVTIAETPSCLADATLLGLVYQNLIDNALKFARTRDATEIDVGWVPAYEDSDVPVYYVRDNGIGFDMKYLDKIFGVFQRLHRDAEYPGTGAGLAIVKRIVNRHGGSIWAHAEDGRGATFFFTLRAAAK